MKRKMATDISPKVRAVVEQRDSIDGWPCCVITGNPHGLQCAHYIPRSRGGLGIPENLVMLNIDIHTAYDNGTKRDEYGEKIKYYLMSHYPGWDESKLYYRK